jgi:hypothetical protein
MVSVLLAQVSLTEVVSLPTATTYGGGDVVGSQLIGRTYNAGDGPGIWIVADGGYRLYLNGELLAEDNQAGRVTFVPMTFLPGENAVSVVGLDGNGAPGVLVQIDELEKSYYSGSSWKSKSVVSDNSWKNAGRDLSQWGSATASGTSTTMPSGATLSGFASGSSSQWIWTNNASDSVAVLLYTFYIQAEGFGAATTGGAGGKIVIAADSTSIQSALQSSDAEIILVPEGTYDLRKYRNAVTEAIAQNRSWCKKACDDPKGNPTRTFYRAAFEANSCASLNDNVTIVTEAENLQRWDRWITTRANKTLVGMGRGANLRGAAIFMRSNEDSKNNIFRNIAVYDVNPHLIEGLDGLSSVGTSSKYTEKFWADHISYKWISDGMDLEYTNEATVSWLDFDGSNEYNCWATDPFMALIQDTKITYANVYWHNTYGRVPKASSNTGVTQVHMYNNYVDYNRYFIVGASGKSSSAYTQVLYENNYLTNAQSRLTNKEDYGYIDWIGNIVTNSTSARYYTNDVAGTTAPTDNVFSPSYTYVKRSAANLPTEIPLNTGVGGHWGSMPAYNQVFGQSNKAPTISLSATTSSSSSGSISFTATASDADGTIANVDFYVGNTKVGSTSASPYICTVTNVPNGIYSLVAKATDNSGLVNTSAFVTVTVTNTTAIDNALHRPVTEAEKEFYRLYDIQGCPIYSGAKLPTVWPAGQVLVVEYGSRGQILKTWVKTQQ